MTEMIPSIEQLSLLVSLIAATISMVSLIRLRRLSEKQIELEEQQAQLARKQLEQIEVTEQLSLLSKIDLTLEGYESNKEIIVANLGPADATDVDLHWTGEMPPFLQGEVRKKLPIRKLGAGKTLVLKTSFSMGSPRSFRCIATWKHLSGDEASEEFELHG